MTSAGQPGDVVSTIVDDAALVPIRERASAELAALPGGRDAYTHVQRYGDQLAAHVGVSTYLHVPRPVIAFRDELRATGGRELVAAFHRCVLLDRISRSRPLLARDPLLAITAPWFEDAASRVVADVFDALPDALDFTFDGFTKDVSVLALRLWPLGAQVVDPRMGVSRRVVFEGGVPTFRRAAALMLNMRGFAPLYEIHTYTRSLHEFTQAGWLACYRLVARMMAQEPEVKGVFGASWFYDPQLERVSPRLAYLRTDPIAGGATFVRVKTTEQTASLALTKSASRKQMFDEGKYVPEQHLMVWPRRELLRWAGIAQ